MGRLGSEKEWVIMGSFHCEPPLSQMLEDPLTRAVMASDGVDREALQLLLREAQLRIAGAVPAAAPSRPTRR
jgi:hypothetical protein